MFAACEMLQAAFFIIYRLFYQANGCPVPTLRHEKDFCIGAAGHDCGYGM